MGEQTSEGFPLMAMLCKAAIQELFENCYTIVCVTLHTPSSVAHRPPADIYHPFNLCNVHALTL